MLKHGFLVLGLLVGLGGSLQSGAHHSFAVHFTADEIISVSGTVTGFRFTNPHGTIEWTAIGEDGEQQHWRAETNSPNILKRRGWARDSLKPGDEVTVTGFPARNDEHYMRVNKVEFADGRETLQGQSTRGLD